MRLAPLATNTHHPETGRLGCINTSNNIIIIYNRIKYLSVIKGHAIDEGKNARALFYYYKIYI